MRLIACQLMVCSARFISVENQINNTKKNPNKNYRVPKQLGNDICSDWIVFSIIC